MAETKQKKGRRGSVVRFFIVGMTIAMLIFSIVVLIGVRLAVSQGLFAMSRDAIKNASSVTSWIR